MLLEAVTTRCEVEKIILENIDHLRDFSKKNLAKLATGQKTDGLLVFSVPGDTFIKLLKRTSPTCSTIERAGDHTLFNREDHINIIDSDGQTEFTYLSAKYSLWIQDGGS